MINVENKLNDINIKKIKKNQCITKDKLNNKNINKTKWPI